MGASSSDDCVQLTDREASVCYRICESLSPVSFSEIKGVLGMHQEVLSRILRRLLTFKLIQKIDGKYSKKS
jgi:DNA-binding HxlR family transcriptional regulator